MPKSKSISSSQTCSQDILDFDREELAKDLFENFGLESFRSRQLVSWLYRRRLKSFEAMTDIAKGVREQLASRYIISRPRVFSVQQSVDGTRKYLFDLEDGSQVESVLIAQPTRHTLCVSSQVGCAIGCKFCRTGLMGLKRHLRTAEIIGQVLAVLDDDEAEDFSNIVFMGMGEPFHNIDNVIRAVKILNDPLGLDFSSRKITVSTSGLVPAIEKFGASEAGANLAVSLNATTDEVRTSIIPINKKWPIQNLLNTLKDYPLKRGKRITIEYVMLKGVNDTEEDLRRLPKLLRGIPSKVNLIPYNENAGLGYYAPSEKWVHYWQKSLLGMGMNSTIRWSKGVDIDAACGQLATKAIKGNA
jgi:23S rRNA (adenine2503-C2)-methyltransferase